MKIYSPTGILEQCDDWHHLSRLNFWLPGYTYRQQFTINHTDDGAQTNYQMKLAIVKGIGTTSAGTLYLQNLALNYPYDFRITKSDGLTLLDNWREEYDTTDGTWWIEFDSIPAHPNNGTFYVYWGKTSDTDASNGDNTFPIFDHFDGTLTDDWIVDAGYAAVASSIMTITGGAAVWKGIINKTSIGKSTWALRAYNKFATDPKYAICGVGTASPICNNIHHTIIVEWEGGSAKQLQTKDATTSSAVDTNFTTNAYKTHDLIVIGNTNARLLENGVERTNSPKTTNPPNSTTQYVSLIGATAATCIQCDWVLVRNYTLNEPTWGTWGVLESAVMTNIISGLIMIGGRH